MSEGASIAALTARVRNMVSRATVAGSDSAAQMQALQIELLADETQDAAEHFEPYGFTSRPLDGAEAAVIFPGGLRSHAVVIAVGDRRYRVKGLEKGEVALHDDQGQSVLIGRDGIRIASALGVSIESGGDLALSADGAVSIEAGGAVSIDAGGALSVEAADALSIDAASLTATTDGSQAFNSDAITIGNGAVKYAARQDDAVDDGTDRISGHSSKVKIA